jgi:hypothetical protein
MPAFRAAESSALKRWMRLRCLRIRRLRTRLSGFAALAVGWPDRSTDRCWTVPFRNDRKNQPLVEKHWAIQGMGQSMGWDFFLKHRNEKALNNQGFNV